MRGDGLPGGTPLRARPPGAPEPALRTVFSTAGHSAGEGFRRWQELLSARLIPIGVQRLDEGPFHARLDFAELGPLQVSRLTQSALRSETTPAAARQHAHADNVVVVFKVAGRSTTLQNDRDAVQVPGDIIVLDHRPSVVATQCDSQALFIEVPRARLEAALGPMRLYAGLSMGAERATTLLATRYLHNLLQVRDQLAPSALARSSEISLDLIVASIADRLARETPQPVSGAVLIQRAKAYVEDHLGDQTLDPPHLAAALGVSLRRLQELFHERGQHISDFIWHRRLEAASKRLTDPASAHLSIGLLAYGCGFASQAHFARRFKDRYGLTPREYRHSALTGAP